MIFDRIREGDLVCWNKTSITNNLDALSNGTMWRHEELDCYMAVRNLRNDALGASCELECINDCGLHLTNSLTRGEYEEYFDELGDDIFVFADSLYDVGMVYAAKYDIENEDEYDFSQDSVEILRQVVEGTLPVFRKVKV